MTEITYKPYDEVRTWYVVFQRSRTRVRPWVHLFTGWRFVHCWAFSGIPGGVVHVEPLHWGLCVTHENCPLDLALERLLQSDVTAVLSITVDYRLTQEAAMRGMYSCVALLKGLLGLKKCGLVITPFQLYKRLCGHSGCIALKPFIPYVGRAL